VIGIEEIRKFVLRKIEIENKLTIKMM